VFVSSNATPGAHRFDSSQWEDIGAETV